MTVQFSSSQKEEVIHSVVPSLTERRGDSQCGFQGGSQKGPVNVSVVFRLTERRGDSQCGFQAHRKERWFSVVFRLTERRGAVRSIFAIENVWYRNILGLLRMIRKRILWLRGSKVMKTINIFICLVPSLWFRVLLLICCLCNQSLSRLSSPFHTSFSIPMRPNCTETIKMVPMAKYAGLFHITSILFPFNCGLCIFMTYF